ncbi:MAG TPA: A24 family peptidase [Gammaproteobacteria bacterium]|nr:A24 family peptidase [Gammaproteobacteria bacterium]
MELFIVWPFALFLAAGLLGLVVGSFLNVVAYRVPIMMERAWREQCAEVAGEIPEGADARDSNVPASGQEASSKAAPAHSDAQSDAPFNLLWPPSACPSCGHRIAPWQNIPILSYVLLRGRCAHCAAPISKRYPIVEAAAAILSLVAAYRFGPTWQLVAALPFTWTLLALALIDMDHKLLPDSITLPLLWAGLVLALFSAGGTPVFFTDLRSSVIGAAAGYTVLWVVFQLFKLLTGKEGMGYGDFKLLAALGAWLGWQLLPLVILLSAGVGAVVGSALLFASGKSRQTPIPFGPYLAAAGWIALLWGREILAWYGGYFHT